MIIYPPKSAFLFETNLLSIRWYGLLIAAAILISYLLVLRRIKRAKLSESKFDSIFMIAVIAGIMGARLGFILQDTGYYFSHLKEIFYVFDGGLSIHGAIILGTVGLYAACRAYKINFISLANFIAPFLLFSGSIGRWGNYFNQEIVGRPVDSGLKMYIDPANRPTAFSISEYFAPVFLYESGLLMIFFLIFLMLEKKLKNYALGYTLFAYSLARIVVEYFRIDYKPLMISLDLAQLISLLIAIFGIVLILFAKRAQTR